MNLAGCQRVRRERAVLSSCEGQLASVFTATECSTRREYIHSKITYKSDFPIFRVPAFGIEVSDDLEDGERERPDERD